MRITALESFLQNIAQNYVDIVIRCDLQSVGEPIRF